MAAGNAILARDTASNSEVLGGAGLFWSRAEELGQLLSEVTTRDLELCKRSLV